MSLPADNPLLAAARDLVLALAEMQLAPTFIGGVAVSLIAQPRYTDDIDAMVVFDTAQADELLETLGRHGFSPRFAGMGDLARRARMVTMSHDRTGSVVDIALGCMPFETELQQRSVRYELAGIGIQIPTPEDLVIMKAIAGRPKDLEDIRSIARAYPTMNRNHLRDWIDQYGELLDNPGLWRQIEELLNEEAN